MDKIANHKKIGEKYAEKFKMLVTTKKRQLLFLMLLRKMGNNLKSQFFEGMGIFKKFKFHC